ncbi:fam-a protein [Plasmodium vinckei brucechwatti]|uniref:Fam-a protein n=1 Tax=Plasmodium vinckei brucechwatti TaxID=119398 RepID=A0A6V7S4Z0_PLAVN|nr:fam-a protein [Plasmodium vinckei brucechwatti]
MNKGYIKVVFFVLSLFVYVNNIIYAAEPASRKGIPKNPPTKVNSSKNSTDKVDSSKNSTDKVDSSKNSTDKVNSSKNSTDKVNSSKNSTDKVNSSKNSTDKVNSSKNSTDKVDSSKNSTDKVNPNQVTPSKSSTDKVNSDSIILENDDLDEIYEQNKSLLCKYPEETEKVTKVMDEAIAALQEYATNEDGYTLSYKYDNDAIRYYKQLGKVNIGKLILKFPDSNRYNEIINILWDPNGAKVFDGNFIEGKVIRVYNPNLAMIQKRYDSPGLRFQGYFYALTKKVKVSEDTTIITFASANIDDHNSKDKEKYTNPILKEINTFKTYINSDNYIRCGKLKKTFVNLSGFLIEKKDKYVNITCISSMDYRVSTMLSHVAKNVMLDALETFINLRQLLLKK